MNCCVFCSLGQDVLLKICENLTVRELIRFGRTCRNHDQLIQDNKVWEERVYLVTYIILYRNQKEEKLKWKIFLSSAEDIDREMKKAGQAFGKMHEVAHCHCSTTQANLVFQTGKERLSEKLDDLTQLKGLISQGMTLKRIIQTYFVTPYLRKRTCPF